VTGILPILPIMIPLVTACVCLLVSGRRRTQRAIALTGATALLSAGIALAVYVWHHGSVVVHVGGWDAPVGIVLVADPFAVVMVLIAALMHLAVSVYTLGRSDAAHERHGYFVAMNILLMGVCGAFLTGDLFNLYVWFEVMLIGSFVLLVMGGGRERMRAGIQYVTLSLLSSAMFLAGVGILYGIAHTLNMAHLSERLALANVDHPWLVTAASVLLLISFGIKAAVFPLYFWLPASYHAPAPAVSAIFAGLLTKVGVYALIRVFVVVMPFSSYIFTVLLVAAGLTMLMGVLGAVSQTGFRRVLGFHIISQIGYMVMGLALVSSEDPQVRELAMIAAVFYILHHIIVKTNLFLVGGIVLYLTGTEDLSRLGGMLKRAPWLAVLFMIPAMSLAGLPPLSGFWAKLTVIKAGLSGGQYLLTAVALLAGILTLVSMLKLWHEVFWKPAPEPQPVVIGGSSRLKPTTASKRSLLLMAAPSALLATLTIAIGLFPQALLSVAEVTGRSILDRAGYIERIGPSANPDTPTTHTSDIYR